MNGRPIALRLALAHLRRLRAAYLEYDEEVRDWYRSGDGRKPNWRVDIDDDGTVHKWNAGGRGYRFPVCIHGRNLCVDHDIPCGLCEQSLTLYEQALAAGWSDYHEFMRRHDVTLCARKALAPEEAMKILGEWSFEPLNVLSAHQRPRRVLP